MVIILMWIYSQSVLLLSTFQLEVLTQGGVERSINTGLNTFVSCHCLCQAVFPLCGMLI